MLYFLYFIVFFLFLFFTGRGCLVLLNKIGVIKSFNDSQIVVNFKIYNLYPLIGLFFIGNLTVLLNFVIPIKNRLVILISLFLIFLNLLSKINLNLKIDQFLLFLLSGFILSISSYSTGLSYDAGLYHLNYQRILQTEKISFGLSNFHSRYGFSSIYDFINTNFWLDNNLILLHFTNLTFIILFFQITYQIFTNSKSLNVKFSIIVIYLYGIFDNFGINGGKNGFLEIEGIAKYDSPFAVLFFLTGLAIKNLIDSKKFNTVNLNFLIIISFFSFQLRPLGALLIIFTMILIFSEKIQFKNYKHSFFIIFFTSTFWFIKNIIISGCLVYPINISCIEKLNWFNSQIIETELKDISNSLVAYKPGDNIITWFNFWISDNEYNLSTSVNFLIFFLTILIIRFIFFKSKNSIDSKYFLFLLVSFLIWITNAPDFRFLIGILILTVSTLFLKNDLKARKEYNFPKLLCFALLILCMLGLPRADNYYYFLNSFLEVPEKQIPKTSYIKNELTYGYTPAESRELCWVNIECTPSYSLPVDISYLNGYKFYQKATVISKNDT